MRKLELHHLLTTTELAALMNWSRWKAARWARRHGIAFADGKRYKVRVGTLLEVFPEAGAAALETREKRGLARDFDRLASRLKNAEDRVRELERAVRDMRRRSRLRGRSERRKQNLQKREDMKESA